MKEGKESYMSAITELTSNSISHLIITSADVVYMWEKQGSKRLNYMPGPPGQVSPEVECLIQI